MESYETKPEGATELRSEDELDEFLSRFESGILPKASWTHAAHITVAAAYLWRSSAELVLPRMRAGILNYNSAVGTPNTATSGYHETLTVFWLRIIAELLESVPEASRLAAVQLAVRHFGPQRDLFRDYYSFDVVRSTEARASWVEPDRVGAK